MIALSCPLSLLSHRLVKKLRAGVWVSGILGLSGEKADAPKACESHAMGRFGTPRAALPKGRHDPGLRAHAGRELCPTAHGGELLRRDGSRGVELVHGGPQFDLGAPALATVAFGNLADRAVA